MSKQRTMAAGRAVGPGALRQLRAARKTPAGPQIDAAPPSQEAFRATIKAGMCPFCGKGPYRMLGSHTTKVHGHTASELREMAGMFKHEPLCSPEISERKRHEGLGKRLPDIAYDGRARKPRAMSAAGIASNREKLKLVPPEQKVAAARMAAAKRVASNAPKYAEMERLWGEEMPLVKIAEQMGVSLAMVTNHLRVAGLLTMDGRRERYRRNQRNQQQRTES